MNTKAVPGLACQTDPDQKAGPGLKGKRQNGLDRIERTRPRRRRKRDPVLAIRKQDPEFGTRFVFADRFDPEFGTRFFSWTGTDRTGTEHP